MPPGVTVPTTQRRGRRRTIDPKGRVTIHRIIMMPANLSGKTGLSFWTRGDQRAYYVQLTTFRSLFSWPLRVSFVAPGEWQHITMAFSEFGQVDSENLISVLFTADEVPGPFRFQIDNVAFIK